MTTITLFLTGKKFQQLKKAGKTHMRKDHTIIEIRVKVSPFDRKIARLKRKIKELERSRT